MTNEQFLKEFQSMTSNELEEFLSAQNWEPELRQALLDFSHLLHGRERGMIPPLLENIRQRALTLYKSFPLRRELTDASFTIAIEANSNRIGVEEIINAMVQLAYTLRLREDVLGLSPTTCEQLEKILAINPKLAAEATERVAAERVAVEQMNKDFEAQAVEEHLDQPQ
jgi:hypothetical protein